MHNVQYMECTFQFIEEHMKSKMKMYFDQFSVSLYLYYFFFIFFVVQQTCYYGGTRAIYYIYISCFHRFYPSHTTIQVNESQKHRFGFASAPLKFRHEKQNKIICITCSMHVGSHRQCHACQQCYAIVLNESEQFFFSYFTNNKIHCNKAKRFIR